MPPLKKIVTGLGLVGGVALTVPDDAEAINIGLKAKKFTTAVGKYSAVWDKGVRAEIDDSTAKILKVGTPESGWAYGNNPYAGRLPKVLKHPELFRNYPEMANISVSYDTKMAKEMGARYSPAHGGFGAEIIVNPHHDSETQLKSILHEAQHHIQHREGWETGKDIQRHGSEAYLNSMGEREASDIVKRRLLTPEERLRTPRVPEIPKSPEYLKSMAEAGKGIPLKDTITKMGVAAPVGAILAEQMAERRGLEKKWSGEVGDTYQPADLAAAVLTGGASIPAKAVAGVVDMGFSAVLDRLINRVTNKVY